LSLDVPAWSFYLHTASRASRAPSSRDKSGPCRKIQVSSHAKTKYFNKLLHITTDVFLTTIQLPLLLITTI
jgi:hypothetical protein